MALAERGEGFELHAVVVQGLAVALRVHEADQVGCQVEVVRAVTRGDLAEIAAGVARHTRLVAAEAPRQARNAAAEGRARDDLLLEEARHLVARAAEPSLGALERERRLPRDEVGEAGGVREVGAAGAPPALAQLRGRRRLARDDAAAVRVPPEHPRLAEPSPRGGHARSTARGAAARAGSRHRGGRRCAVRRPAARTAEARVSRASPPERILAKPRVRREAGGTSTPGPRRRYLPRRLRMALHADLTREIDEGPAGPAVGAFFDVDGTLIAGFSAVA